MGFMNRNDDKPLKSYATLSARDQAMSTAIGNEVRAALAEDRAERERATR